MERHTLIGYEMLKDSGSDLLDTAAVIALTHHERWDGNGYPNGESGDAIPIEGRLVAVADVFDALLSDRSYRPAFSLDEAVALIVQGSGSQFDPSVVEVLVENLDEVKELRAG
jgi:Response regulator containing a CheY-like receiver domain and an HD-GYP domain